MWFRGGTEVVQGGQDATTISPKQPKNDNARDISHTTMQTLTSNFENIRTIDTVFATRTDAVYDVVSQLCWNI